MEATPETDNNLIKDMEFAQLFASQIIKLISNNITDYEQYIIPSTSSINEKFLLKELEKQARESEIKRELESAIESTFNFENEISTKSNEDLESMEMHSVENQEINCLKESIAKHEQQLQTVSILNKILCLLI